MTIEEALEMESEIAYCLLNSKMKQAVYTVFDAMREQWRGNECKKNE